MIPGSDAFFPVRVVVVGKRFLDVEALDAAQADAMAVEFQQASANRRFERPALSAMARFGGCDERPVNSGRESGPELRLLPTHYGTTTARLIREKHAADPDRWPLPTGLAARWFAGPPARSPRGSTSRLGTN